MIDSLYDAFISKYIQKQIYSETHLKHINKYIIIYHN